MYPGTWAASTPDKPALIIAETGETTTCAELGERSLRLAHALDGSASYDEALAEPKRIELPLLPVPVAEPGVAAGEVA